MGKPSWEVGRANKEEPRVLGAQSSGWCKPWDWLHDLQQGRPGQQSSTLTSPDPSPQQAFTWTDSPAHSNRATAIKSKPPREGKCPSRPEPQPLPAPPFCGMQVTPALLKGLYSEPALEAGAKKPEKVLLATKGAEPGTRGMWLRQKPLLPSYLCSFSHQDWPWRSKPQVPLLV